MFFVEFEKKRVMRKPANKIFPRVLECSQVRQNFLKINQRTKFSRLFQFHEKIRELEDIFRRSYEISVSRKFF